MLITTEKTVWKATNVAAIAPVKGFKSFDIFAHVFNSNLRNDSNTLNTPLPYMADVSASDSSLGLNIPTSGRQSSIIPWGPSSTYNPFNGLTSEACLLPLTTEKPSFWDSSPIESGAVVEDDECELPDSTYKAIRSLLDETEKSLPRASFEWLASPSSNAPSLTSPFDSLPALTISPSPISLGAVSLLPSPIGHPDYAYDNSIFEDPYGDLFPPSPNTASIHIFGGENLKGKAKENYVYDPLAEEEEQRRKQEVRRVRREDYLMIEWRFTGEGPSRVPVSLQCDRAYIPFETA
ncbi:hypothetical protein M422DRAFT_780317 [Sphaerobolus stellatus SS14]|uniref:Uncharacterized protein n=1 Tax=Sphaerobolus stellatus (strain SS14) TaxID=990650 RepID=A0A0C9VIQ2_SPHS4|nr:hypothetical protein M422DRAFT_780317 [Sphaerobolus stellatus SS14]